MVPLLSCFSVSIIMSVSVILNSSCIIVKVFYLCLVGSQDILLFILCPGSIISIISEWALVTQLQMAEQLFLFLSRNSSTLLYMHREAESPQGGPLQLQHEVPLHALQPAAAAGPSPPPPP